MQREFVEQAGKKEFLEKLGDPELMKRANEVGLHLTSEMRAEAIKIILERENNPIPKSDED